MPQMDSADWVTFSIVAMSIVYYAVVTVLEHRRQRKSRLK